MGAATISLSRLPARGPNPRFRIVLEALGAPSAAAVLWERFTQRGFPDEPRRDWGSVSALLGDLEIPPRTGWRALAFLREHGFLGDTVAREGARRRARRVA